MAYSELPKLKKNSVSTTIASPGINDTDTTIPVTELAVFYDSDSNLITKGIVIGYDNATETYAEEITITGASGTSGAGNLTGATRGVNGDGTIGAAKAHIATTNIAVMFSTGIYELIRENDIGFETTKADLASPVFTGTPTAPTASIGTNTTQIATTAFVQEATRQLLTANTTYYVATTGSDVTGDGTSGNPWATIQHAYDYIACCIDTAGYLVTIQLADGTYSAGLSVISSWSGGGGIVIQGNTGSYTNVIISGVTNAFSNYAVLPAKLSLKYMQITSTTGSHIYNTGVGTIEIDNIDFGASTGPHINVFNNGAVITAYGKTYTISGGGYAHAFASNGGFYNAGWSVVTISGTPAFSYYAYAEITGVILFSSGSITGSATGIRYCVVTNSVCATAGQTLPGDRAGSTATGGQYT